MDGFIHGQSQNTFLLEDTALANKWSILHEWIGNYLFVCKYHFDDRPIERGFDPIWQDMWQRQFYVYYEPFKIETKAKLHIK